MDCARNIITANFSGGGTSATTAPLWQWDYGQVLCITGIDLPAAFEVHFSTNRTGGVSTTAVGADGQVTIPNVLLTIGKNLNAWIYLSDAQGEGETEYSILIPVKARPMPETYDAEVSGEFDDVVRQVSEYAQTAQTAADNAGASASAAAASASEAAASASAAESAKTAAETAQGKAEDAQAAAETAAQTATEKAQQTEQDAAQAAQSKADAESAAGRAEAAQTGAESAKTDAETAAQGAADSTSAASASASSAGQAATSAAQSATAAAGSATTAQGAAQTATAKAGEASASATAAAASETAAQTAQTAAEAAKDTAVANATTATTKAAEAAQSASGAAQSKTDAEAAATRAEQAAASLTVDSALSDSSVNPVQNKVITGELTNVKNAIDEFIYAEPTLPTPDRAWIRYSNGERVGSSATRLFVFNASGIKRIKAFLTSDNPVLCAIAFYTSDGISTSGYMANNSVDFLSGVHNDGAWYETPVPDECVTIAITSKVPSDSVAEYKILFVMDYATKSDVVGLNAEISELNTDISGIQSESLTPNAFDDLEWYRASYVRYSDGARIGSGTYLRTYYFSNNGVGRKVKATLYCGDTVPAIIAFYSTKTLDTSGYLKSASVQAKAGWATYEADIPAECKLIVFTHRSDYAAGSGEPSIQFLGSDIALNAYLSIDTAVQTSETAMGTVTGVKNLAVSRVLNSLSKPCYDHLFVNELGDSIVIPHESVYHVRLSKAFGFNMIEANVAPTSDGVYVVNHLISGKFGGYFHHVDGTTDISDIALNAVTWAWVQENVRYNSQIPKYRTRPCRLEEFLAECKANNLIPFLGRSGDANVVAIADHIMGKGQYVAYDGTRTTCPDGVLYSFRSDLTTKEDILNYCETKGKPFAYGLGNVNSFTDAQLQEIVDLLHANGYWIGVSYADSKWYKYAEMGFDFNGTQRLMNRIECGNLHNISSIFGFGGYTITGATETDGVLTFDTAGNIYPKVDDTTYNVCAIDLEMVFSGSITLYPIGEMKSATGYNSDGSKSVFVTIPIINGSPYFHIVAGAGTVFYELNYKASVLS